jgi:trk system potassium uptake protein
VDAVPVQLFDQRRIDRWRHQDDACAAAVQAGVSRTGARHAPGSVVYNVRLGGQTAPHSVLFAVLAFAFVYMVSIVSMTLLLAFTGLDIVTAFSAVVASVNNTGPGLGLVGPATTFAVLEDFQTWVCTFAMLLGRLEIFTLLVVLTPAFWRK